METTTTTTFAAQAAKLKIDLNYLISKRLEEFHAETGSTPASIDVELVSTTVYGDQFPRHVVNEVRLRFNV